MLKILVESVHKLFGTQPQPYLEILYKAMLTTAYFGLLRVGEITLSEHAIKMQDVNFGMNEKKIMLVLRLSKTHGRNTLPQIVKFVGLGKQLIKKDFYSFMLMADYIRARKKQKKANEQFFVYRDRTPVTAYNYHKMLKKLLKICGFNQDLYDTHSTRSGRAMDLYHVHKLSLEKVCKIGRWKSTSVYAYLQTTC